MRQKVPARTTGMTFEPGGWVGDQLAGALLAAAVLLADLRERQPVHVVLADDVLPRDVAEVRVDLGPAERGEVVERDAHAQRPHRSQSPATTSSLASAVLSLGHQLTSASLR